MIDLDPFAAQHRQAVRRGEKRARSRRASESRRRASLRQRNRAASRPRLATATWRRPSPRLSAGSDGRRPAGRHAHDEARLLERATSSRSRIASVGVQRSGWKISPESTIAFSQCAALAGAAAPARAASTARPWRPRRRIRAAPRRAGGGGPRRAPRARAHRWPERRTAARRPCGFRRDGNERGRHAASGCRARRERRRGLRRSRRVRSSKLRKRRHSAERHAGVKVFAAAHRRRFVGEAGEFLVVWLLPLVFPARHRAAMNLIVKTRQNAESAGSRLPASPKPSCRSPWPAPRANAASSRVATALSSGTSVSVRSRQIAPRGVMAVAKARGDGEGEPEVMRPRNTVAAVRLVANFRLSARPGQCTASTPQEILTRRLHAFPPSYSLPFGAH